MIGVVSIISIARIFMDSESVSLDSLPETYFLDLTAEIRDGLTAFLSCSLVGTLNMEASLNIGRSCNSKLLLAGLFLSVDICYSLLLRL